MLNYEENSEQAAELLRLVIPRLARLDIPVNPVNYALWYEYLLGRNHELNARLDEVSVDKASFSSELAEGLFRDHLMGVDANRLECIGAEAWSLFVKMANRFTEAGGELTEFQGQLADVGHAFEKCSDLPEAKRVMPGLVKHVSLVMASNASLSEQLQASASEMEHLRQELEVIRLQARLDPLTGIANRKTLNDRLTKALEKEPLEGHANCLMMIDVDHFKRVNDDYGHLVGDKVLKFVAAMLHQSVKGRDFVARYGGEEFSVLLEGTPCSGAVSVANQIRANIETAKIRRSDTGELLRPVTVSIGVACASEDTPESLIDRADKALYDAKNSGRNRVTLARIK